MIFLKKSFLKRTAFLALLLLVCLILPVPAAQAQVPVTLLNVDPDTLNLASKGNWITAYLATGKYYTWQHGFLPGPDSLNHPDVTPNVGYKTWYHYASPDLTDLVPGQNPVTKTWSAKPELLLGVEVGGNGWDFRGIADSVYLSGVVAGVPSGNLVLNGDFNSGFDYWVKTSWKNPWNPSLFYWNINASEGTPPPGFDYQRVNSGADGGGIGVFQRLWHYVAGWDSLSVSYDVYLISNTLTNSGWWWTVFGGWGETPGRIIVHYMAGLQPERIDPDSVKLYGIDTNNDGTADVVLNLPTVGPSSVDSQLMVKFSRPQLIAALKAAGVPDDSTVGLIVTGSFVDGTPFSAVDKIRVITE